MKVLFFSTVAKFILVFVVKFLFEQVSPPYLEGLIGNLWDLSPIDIFPDNPTVATLTTLVGIFAATELAGGIIEFVFKQIKLVLLVLIGGTVLAMLGFSLQLKSLLNRLPIPVLESAQGGFSAQSLEAQGMLDQILPLIAAYYWAILAVVFLIVAIVIRRVFNSRKIS